MTLPNLSKQTIQDSIQQLMQTFRNNHYIQSQNALVLSIALVFLHNKKIVKYLTQK